VRTWRRRRANRAARAGWLGRLQTWIVPLVAIATVVPLFEQVFLSFLALPIAQWGEGVGAVTLRAGVAVLAMLSLDVYTAVVRGPDRAVLTMLPIDAVEVVRYSVIRVAVERWWLLPAVAALLGPIAWAGAVDLWLLAILSVFGSWMMGLCVSAAVHLLAIEVAESPSWEGVLDRIRGQNPRPQAAFLYAPGVVLLGCGMLVGQASFAVPKVATGDLLSVVWLVLPLGISALAWSRLPRLAPGSWFKGSAVLAEIDARYAALADREEGLRVYLDWVVRFLPADMARFVLKDMRHGWRARRGLISGAWFFGLASFAAGWTEGPLGVERAALVTIGGVWMCAAVGVLLEQDEPAFLRAWLPPGGVPRWTARALVLILWVQPCVWLGALSVGLRQGGEAGLVVFGFGVGCAGLAIPTAILCSRLGQRGLTVYAPTAVILAALVATTTGTG